MKRKNNFTDALSDTLASIEGSNVTHEDKVKALQNFYNSKSNTGLADQLISDLNVPSNKENEVRSRVIELENRLENKFSRWTRGAFILAIIIFFSGSYLFAYKFINQIIDSEMILISQKLLDAKDRSINSVTVAALIAATVTQTGLAFYAVAKYLFNNKTNSSTPSQ